MARTVAALYDTRAEAEFARGRLVSRLKASSVRIIGNDTIGAIDGLNFEAAAAASYRDEVRAGGCLLVAEVPGGINPDRIIGLLEDAIGHEDRRAAETRGDGDRGVHVRIDGDVSQSDQVDGSPRVPAHEDDEERPAVSKLAQTKGAAGSARIAAPKEEQPAQTDQKHAAGDARIRSFTHDVPVEEEVRLQDQTLEVERRESGRQLSENELAGLFEERVIEVVAMREEPVVNKIAVVHEEVIVRKNTRERAHTIRDSVRVTEVEVADVSGTDAPPLFGGNDA